MRAEPVLAAGEYFRAKGWAWHPIHALLIELCSDRLDVDTLQGMA